MGKAALVILIISVVASLILMNRYPAGEIKFGVTFSPRYARYLKLDWQKIYLSLLDDLKVKNLRIPTYWDSLQKSPGQYDFGETDYLLNEAQKRGVRVILVVGEKQPRWPECYIPAWAKRLSLKERQEKILEFIQKVVERYKNSPAVWVWQVENEPMLGFFGSGCDVPDKSFLKKEAMLVKSLSSKEVLMTDSGELGLWTVPMQLSDVFGTTLYRQVYDKNLGYIAYPVPPGFYSVKSSLIRHIFAPGNKKTIIVELQAEPWLANGTLIPADQQIKLFSLSQMRSFVDYAKKTGFDENYLWGVEWWYFMAKQGHPEYLEYAKTLFR